MFEQRDDNNDRFVEEEEADGQCDDGRLVDSPRDPLAPFPWARDEVSPASIVTFDLRGTAVRTTTETLAACEPGSLLAHLASPGCNDRGPVFVDCSPGDFMLVVDHLCYGAVPADVETRQRLACVADRLHMPALAAACRDDRVSGAPGHRAAIAEMNELAKFIMASGRITTGCRTKERERLDRCYWAIDRHDHLDQSLSARPLTTADRRRLCDETAALRTYILDAKIANGKVGRAALHWAKCRHARIHDILAAASRAPPTAVAAAGTRWAWARRSAGLVGDGAAIGVGLCLAFWLSSRLCA
ncbi:BTB domain containing protein [Pandoravirus japonicus]|uniref:BTB domain containing protein n=1 Tax=Pandoravirus japonicus TaxID=2823154 RepID=A0A811BMY3_9VIRU|nr:BTB domain containing protein [Pandoravirus japonicus]